MSLWQIEASFMRTDTIARVQRFCEGLGMDTSQLQLATAFPRKVESFVPKITMDVLT